jgi:multidrug efflux pump subunit AcrA (membrane-fusion protein)
MKRWLMLLSVVAVLAVLAWGALRMVQATSGGGSSGEVPVTTVKKGRVTITVAARGELQGGNPDMMTAPMTGGGDMAITYMRAPGELVNAGDTVVEFDTTQQEYNLREAQADLAEAEQQVIQAESTAAATEEETRYAMLSTASDVKVAELEMRRNPLLAAIAARENEIALETAKSHQRQAEQDFNNKKATVGAGIAIQKAAENKAKVMVDMAQRTIDSMVLKAKTAGYVNIQQNTNQNLMYYGMQLPNFQTGDSARAGQAVAQIPDLHHWEVSANIPELDRGHLNPGQKVTVRAAALAGRQFAGHIKSLGGTTGPPWNRSFECRIALDEAGPELRPGMSSNLVITVESLDNVLWVPSQAVFEVDGRTFVYLRGPEGFVPHDVALVRRSESQAVLTGIREGDLVALSNPDQQNKTGRSGQAGGALKAVAR